MAADFNKEYSLSTVAHLSIPAAQTLSWSSHGQLTKIIKQI
jgi:hypothetical protein